MLEWYKEYISHRAVLNSGNVRGLLVNGSKQHVMVERENFLVNSDTFWYSELLPTSPTENKNY